MKTQSKLLKMSRTVKKVALINLVIFGAVAGIVVYRTYNKS